MKRYTNLFFILLALALFVAVGISCPSLAEDYIYAGKPTAEKMVLIDSIPEGGYSSETTPHSKVEKPFYISSSEVAYGEWYEVYQWAIKNGYAFPGFTSPGYNSVTPDDWKSRTHEHPVVEITLEKAVVWCNAISEKEGLTPVYEYEGRVIKKISSASSFAIKKISVNETADGYRLPSEAEWEYAAKGGKDFKYSGSDNIEKVAVYKEKGLRVFATQPIFSKEPNDYGLYDMSGNIMEWCFDNWWNIDEYVYALRGGSFMSEEDDCAITARHWDSVSAVPKEHTYGFRVARSATK